MCPTNSKIIQKIKNGDAKTVNKQVERQPLSLYYFEKALLWYTSPSHTDNIVTFSFCSFASWPGNDGKTERKYKTNQSVEKSH